MTTNNYVHLIDSKFVNISGDDRKDFLQGLITNDIKKCNSDNPIYACLLTPQGKFIADFFITEDNSDFLIEIHEKFFSDFLKKLNIYKLRSKVSICEKNDYISLVIFEKNESLKFDKETINFTDPRCKNLGKKIYINQKK